MAKDIELLLVRKNNLFLSIEEFQLFLLDPLIFY